MASRFSNEFQVGLFVVLVAAGIVGLYFWTKDGLFQGAGTYTLTLRAPRADGLNEGTAVKLAGVEVGSVGDIKVSGGAAEIQLIIDERYELPVDSTAELKATGLLGDYFVMLDLGDTDDATLADGDRITYGDPPGDVDEITRQVELITEDIKAITEVLREMAEDRRNREHLEATLANTDALTADLAEIAAANRRDIRAIVESVRRLSESLEGVVDESGRDLDEEFDKIKDATDTLQRSLDNVESITGKVDRGEGTVGALINDRETVDALNDTIENTNEVIESFSGLQAEVYNWNRGYVGTNPTRGPDGERLTEARARELFPPDGRNRYNLISSHAIGVHLKSQEDFWYTFEFIAHPIGAISLDEYQIPGRFTGGDPLFYREWRVTQNFRYSFLINKRWRNVSFRLGVRESSGGAGMTVYGPDDRFQFHADVFDFTFGGYPVVEDPDVIGLNTRLFLRYEPVDGLFFEAGTENIVPGIRYGYVTGFVGAGLHFTDNDIKLLFATLPLNF
jgi:phospholipid/cholesterol/gamma-HCH transport system substrate-binding protein